MEARYDLRASDLVHLGSTACVNIVRLQLVSHIYSEHLLEVGHFLDWIVTSFCDSDLDHLPTWLLILQMHWKEMFIHRCRGRQLSQGLLKQISRVR